MNALVGLSVSQCGKDRMNPIEAAYTATADELTKRILALIPAHPEIMTIESPFDLFKIDGFKCDDIGPSLAQAGWALGKARQIHKANNRISKQDH